MIAAAASAAGFGRKKDRRVELRWRVSRIPEAVAERRKGNAVAGRRSGAGVAEDAEDVARRLSSSS